MRYDNALLRQPTVAVNSPNVAVLRKMTRLGRAAQLLALLFCLGAGTAFAMTKPADWSESDWETFIEEGVQIGLGEALSKAGSAVPLVDVYSALGASAGVTRISLHAWLQRRMVEVGDNTETVNRFQAYDTCLMTGDCSRLQQLSQTPRNTTACHEVSKIEQPETKAGNKITVEASTIHVMNCAGGQYYLYEYRNRADYRVIKPPDWAHAIGGKDFSTMAEAMAVAAAQTPAPPSPSPPSPSPTPAPAPNGTPAKLTLMVNNYTLDLDLATGTVISDAGERGGSDITIKGVGDFDSAKVSVTADHALPLGWSLWAQTCCNVVIPICKAVTGATACHGEIPVPKDWPGVNVHAAINKANQNGTLIGANGAGLILWKKP
jgi:hypothetical protein